jgi:trans-aconitate methyltransferase
MADEAERIIDLYRRHAHAWDQDRGRSLFERPWLDRFLAHLPPKASILDLGCGGGEPIARYLVDQGHAMTGIDAAPDLIALCEKRFPAHAWSVADMRGLSLGRTFNGLLAWDSFFHLRADDQRRMFAVFRRHAAPKAALMFTSGPAAGEAIGAYRGEPLYHASLDEAEYRLLLREQGFEVVSHSVEGPDCGGHTVWLAQLR